MSDSQNSGNSNPGQTYAVLQNGMKVPMQGPLPNVLVDTVKYYTCTRLHHKMLRADGKAIIFLFGTLGTKNLYDQEYLDKEIADENPYVRAATAAEIDAHLMRTDYRGTLEKQLRPQLEQEAELKAKTAMKADMQKKVSEGKLNLTEAQIDALFEDTEGITLIQGVDGVKPGESIQSGTGRLSGITNTRGLPVAPSGK
ncbi:unnamed protein product [Sphagnum jensenii]